MKYIISTIRFLFVIAIALLASYYIHEKYIFDTIPGRWYLNGEMVQDSTTYTGQYFRVNDSIRLVTEDYYYGPACFVYVKEGEEFKRTDIRNFWRGFNNKFLMIRELQIRYEQKFKRNEVYQF